MPKIIRILAVVATLMAAETASAIVLSIRPYDQEVDVGERVYADVVVSGLGEVASPSLGAFLVEVLFDPDVLAFDSAAYGSHLGDPDPFAFETDVRTTTNPGSVALDEFSFLFDFELDDIQPAEFVLAGLEFHSLVTGRSEVSFGAIDLSDALGSVIVPDLVGAMVEVRRASTVPEPGTSGLLLGGLLIALTARRWGRRQRRESGCETAAPPFRPGWSTARARAAAGF